jgi:hypothetical protein
VQIRNRKIRPIALGSAGLVSLVVLLSAGSCDNKVSEPFHDAPRSAHANSDPATVIEMPDGFSNLATKCIAPGIRGTVVFKNDRSYGSVSTVIDPKC